MASIEKVAVSVKGGENVDVTMVRDLAHVVKREKAQMGVFITLAEPTKPMHTEAVKESFYETSYGRHSRLQIVTVEQLLTINSRLSRSLIHPGSRKQHARRAQPHRMLCRSDSESHGWR
jgi:Restriction endonuclease